MKYYLQYTLHNGAYKLFEVTNIIERDSKIVQSYELSLSRKNFKSTATITGPIDWHVFETKKEAVIHKFKKHVLISVKHTEIFHRYIRRYFPEELLWQNIH